MEWKKVRSKNNMIKITFIISATKKRETCCCFFWKYEKPWDL